MYFPSVLLTIDLRIATSQSANSNTTLTLVVSSFFRNSVRVITVTFLDSIGPVPLSFPPGGTDQNLLYVRFSDLEFSGRNFWVTSWIIKYPIKLGIYVLYFGVTKTH